MNSSYDYIVVGAGLAGACAAFHLAQQGSVLVLESGRIAGGASGAAAGIVNPIMGRKAKRTWEAEKALAALETLLEAAGCSFLFRKTGVLRPTRGSDQSVLFRKAADEYPEHTEWLTERDVHLNFPDIAAPHGGLMVHTGGAVDIGQMVSLVLDASVKSGVDIMENTEVTGWSESRSDVTVNTASGSRYHARTVICTCGAGYSQLNGLKNLRFHAVKGQVVHITGPELSGPLPCISGSGYITPEPRKLVLGTSYEHDFTDTRPNPAETQAILAKTSRMLPAIRGMSPEHVDVGIRVTVPGKRLPAVGPVPGFRRVWIFSGLGSRGLLTAPLIAEKLPDYVRKPDMIPPKLLPERNEHDPDI